MIKTTTLRALPLLAVTFSFALSPLSSNAEMSAVQKEIIKRTQAIREAEAHIANGDRAFVDQDYEQALADYNAALEKLPNAPIAADLKQLAIAKYADATVEVARLRADRGAYTDARGLLDSVLKQDPDHQAANKLLMNLDDDDLYNPALRETHVVDVQEVERFLRMGIGYYDLGDFENATLEFEQVLRIDPTNSAARRMMAKVEERLIDYGHDARDHTRKKMLREVVQAWETPVPILVDFGPKIDQEGGNRDLELINAIERKLDTIILPSVEFRETRLDAALEFLRIRSEELDPTPEKTGVNFIIDAESGAANATITLESTNLPLKTALEYICRLSGMKYKVDPHAVIISSRSEVGNPDFFTRIFKVPPSFLDQGIGNNAGGGAGPVDPFAQPAPGAGGGITPRMTAQEILEANNVQFPPGSSAFYSKTNSTLTVTQTAQNMALIETFVQALIDAQGHQIHIQSKFLEVEQRDTDELGFDWLLGPFNLGSSERAFGSGGVAGSSAQPVSVGEFAFTTPGSGGVPAGGFPVSRGLRFGTEAVTPDSIDGLLSSGIETTAVSSVSPGVFSIAGIFTDPQFQVIIRAINQRKGVDLMTAPSVTTKPGLTAEIDIIREFIYPTEFEPPTLPNAVGGGGGAGFIAGGGGAANIPVVPTTPQEFLMRPVGVTMDVSPVVGNDKYTIDLEIQPEVVEFEGFINYGSPIQVLGTDALGNPVAVTLSSNQINQPIFATRRVHTNVTVWDGQTVAIGGLIREDAQIVNDKIPVVGDLPLIGRLFQTKAEEYFKRNLIIFVTCRLIRPDGRPLNEEIGKRQRRDDLPPRLPRDPQPIQPGDLKNPGYGFGKNAVPGFGK